MVEQKYPKPHIIQLEKKGEQRTGFTTIIEQFNDVPFEIKRVFWTYETPQDFIRGEHAHKETEEVLIAVNGKIEVHTLSQEKEKTCFTLDAPTKGLYLPPNIWRSIKQEGNAMLLVLASTEYDPNDYLTSLEEWTSSV